MIEGKVAEMTEARTYMDGYTDLLEQSFEINLNNYGPEDVERLNDWAINAYAALGALQAEVKHLNLHLKATQSGRDAALARLSKIERQEPVAEMILVDMGIGDARQLRVNWLMDGYLDVGAKLYAAAGASPVEPSLARVVEPVATGVKQLAAQLHDDQKWTVEEQQQFAVFLARFPSESSQGIISLGDAWKHGKACATPKATATLLSRATDLHEKAQMSWKEAEALALSEAGVTLSTIDELIGNSAYRGVDSLLTTPDEIRDFTRAILVHSSNIDALYATPQAAAQPPAPSDTAITYMTGYSDCKEWTQPSQAVELVAENERLRVALRFYANGEHYYLDEEEEFDTVSGEPANWLHSGVEDSATSIEDGAVARLTLRGEVITCIDGDEDGTPTRIDGEPDVAAINAKGAV